MILQGKRVLVTGGGGFLGRHVVAELEKCGAEVDHPPSSLLELRCSAEIDWRLKSFKPDTLIHLAATCGGIGANAREPGRYVYENSMMALNVMNSAMHKGVNKLVGIGSVCMYPKHCPTPFKEDDIWNGYPEETNAPYGIAKRLLLEMAQAYRKQYGFNAITLIPANLYGPGDNFDLETSHVIPALIRKAIEAKESGGPLVVWGDGTPTRDFLFVKDAAREIVRAAAEYDSPEPINIGTGVECSITDLVRCICKAVGYWGPVEYDTSKPNGQQRRCVSTDRWRMSEGVSLLRGIKETVEWYKANCGVAV